jgi:hypothetical protein
VNHAETIGRFSFSRELGRVRRTHPRRSFLPTTSEFRQDGSSPPARTSVSKVRRTNSTRVASSSSVTRLIAASNDSEGRIWRSLRSRRFDMEANSRGNTKCNKRSTARIYRDQAMRIGSLLPLLRRYPLDREGKLGNTRLLAQRPIQAVTCVECRKQSSSVPGLIFS